MTDFSCFVITLLFTLAPTAFAEETSIKQDFKDAGHSIKREWKKGWHATKKEAKKVGKGAAGAAEKTAKKVKEKLD
jgi:hypothetical protein